MEHSLRSLVHKDSDITDAELDELETLADFDNHFDSEQYEFNGNHILTDSQAVADDAIREMCCGIYTNWWTLKSGKAIYYAFDYGH